VCWCGGGCGGWCDGWCGGCVRRVCGAGVRCDTRRVVGRARNASKGEGGAEETRWWSMIAPTRRQVDLSSQAIAKSSALVPLLPRLPPYLRACVLGCLLAYVHAYVAAQFHAYFHVRFHVCFHARMWACMYACLLTRICPCKLPCTLNGDANSVVHTVTCKSRLPVTDCD